MNADFLKNNKQLFGRTNLIPIDVHDNISEELEHSTENYIDAELLRKVTDRTMASVEWRFTLYDQTYAS
jgi:hypothetical protein